MTLNHIFCCFKKWSLNFHLLFFFLQIRTKLYIIYIFKNWFLAITTCLDFYARSSCMFNLPIFILHVFNPISISSFLSSNIEITNSQRIIKSWLISLYHLVFTLHQNGSIPNSMLVGEHVSFIASTQNQHAYQYSITKTHIHSEP